MTKKQLDHLFTKIFLLNNEEIKNLNQKKKLILKDLQNYDSLKFIKFLITIERKYKINISPKNFKIFFNTCSIYKFLEKMNKRK
jgi:acyl carrier protein